MLKCIVLHGYATVYLMNKCPALDVCLYVYKSLLLETALES